MSKTVIITGASAGIGRETAVLLAEKGYKVYALARRLELMDDLKQQGVIPMAMDITDSAQIKSVTDVVLAKEGQIHALINNAGYGAYGALENMDLDTAESIFDVNFFGLLEMTQAVLPSMRGHREGRIVNISSFSSKMNIWIVDGQPIHI